MGKRVGKEGKSWDNSCKRKTIEQEGWKPLAQVFERVSQLLAHWLQPALQAYHQRHASLAPFAKRIVALDEMCRDQVSRWLPILRHLKKGDMQLLPGKLVTLFDVRLQQWSAIEYISSAKENGMKQAYLTCLPLSKKERRWYWQIWAISAFVGSM